MKPQKILIILNYYYPYVSGVSEYAKCAAEMMAQKGHHVTVLTSNHANLKPYEVMNGVHIYRTRVLCKISKGVISPDFILRAKKLSKDSDIVNMHLPMLESGLISLLVSKEKLITMYQCDVNLPKSILNNLIVKIMDISHSICLNRSRRIMVTSIDYAEHSRIASRYTQKLIGIEAPVKNYHRVSVEKNGSKRVIGFCGRIVEEKGLDVLIKAFEIVKKEIPDAILQVAGDYKNVAGGSIYPQLKQYIDEHTVKDVFFLGKIREEKMEEYFSGLDVFVLPSTNSLEAFGMVQVEAMKCGVPVVSSDLYGVRTIVQKTGAGLVSKAGDEKNLADCIIEVLLNREKYARELSNLDQYFSNKIWSQKYMDALMR